MGHDIVLAVSGGVDSAVSVVLLQELGFRVTPVFFRMGLADQDEQQARAENIGRKFGLKTEVVELETRFREKVLSYFCRSYYQGITPNPCVVCNPYIKFGALLQVADRIGAERIATGHYARVVEEEGISKLCVARDHKKDQSYFLCGLTQKQLGRSVFPLGEWTKEDVRHLAAGVQLADLTGDESQDVCFLKNTSVGEFLRHRCSGIKEEMRQGFIVDRHGAILGRHAGIYGFTVGQRRGLGIPDSTPYYVLDIDPEYNRIVAGKKEELWQSVCRVANLNWLSNVPPELPASFKVRIRHRHPGVTADLYLSDNGLLIEFTEPQRAVTPGQYAVFYRGEEVLGGGVIQRVR